MYKKEGIIKTLDITAKEYLMYSQLVVLFCVHQKERCMNRSYVKTFKILYCLEICV